VQLGPVDEHSQLLAFYADACHERLLSTCWSTYMAAQSQIRIASMEVPELLKLREDVNRVLVQKTEDIKRQLQHLEGVGSPTVSGRRTAVRRSSLRGIKVPPKYRHPKDRKLVWAGRGAVPRWMQERIKKGAKREDFLIAKANGKSPTAPKRAKKASLKKASLKKASLKKASRKKAVRKAPEAAASPATS
jgi:DNA-binding protein H-NS